MARCRTGLVSMVAAAAVMAAAPAATADPPSGTGDFAGYVRAVPQSVKSATAVVDVPTATCSADPVDPVVVTVGLSSTGARLPVGLTGTVTVDCVAGVPRYEATARNAGADVPTAGFTVAAGDHVKVGLTVSRTAATVTTTDLDTGQTVTITASPGQANKVEFTVQGGVTDRAGGQAPTFPAITPVSFTDLSVAGVPLVGHRQSPFRYDQVYRGTVLLHTSDLSDGGTVFTVSQP